jgi:hypothetical protein
MAVPSQNQHHEMAAQNVGSVQLHTFLILQPSTKTEFSSVLTHDQFWLLNDRVFITSLSTR